MALLERSNSVPAALTCGVSQSKGRTLKHANEQNNRYVNSHEYNIADSHYRQYYVLGVYCIRGSVYWCLIIIRVLPIPRLGLQVQADTL